MMRTTDRTVVRFLFYGKGRFCERKRSGNRTMSAPEKKGDCGKEKEEIISKKYFLKKMKLFVDKQKKMW